MHQNGAVAVQNTTWLGLSVIWNMGNSQIVLCRRRLVSEQAHHGAFIANKPSDSPPPPPPLPVPAPEDVEASTAARSAALSCAAAASRCAFVLRYPHRQAHAGCPAF